MKSSIADQLMALPDQLSPIILNKESTFQCAYLGILTSGNYSGVQTEKVVTNLEKNAFNGFSKVAIMLSSMHMLPVIEINTHQSYIITKQRASLTTWISY